MTLAAPTLLPVPAPTRRRPPAEPDSAAATATAGTFEDRVIAALRSLGPGEVLSYGELAAEAGSPRAARAVGALLRRGLPDVPWWRVVRAGGRIVCPHGAEQEARLQAEGVGVRGGRVHPWPPADPGQECSIETGNCR